MDLCIYRCGTFLTATRRHAIFIGIAIYPVSAYNLPMSVDVLPTQTVRSSIDDVVSANVRACAGYLGLRQVDIAEVLGVKQATVSRKWFGGRAWQLTELDTLAQLFGVTVADLVTPRENEEARTDVARADRGSRDWIRTSNRPINSRMLCR